MSDFFVSKVAIDHPAKNELFLGFFPPYYEEEEPGLFKKSLRKECYPQHWKFI